MNTLSFRVHPIGEHITSRDLEYIRKMDRVVSEWKPVKITIKMSSFTWIIGLAENMTEDDQDILWAAIQQVDTDHYRVTLVTETGEPNE